MFIRQSIFRGNDAYLRKRADEFQIPWTDPTKLAHHVLGLDLTHLLRRKPCGGL
jgi:hypothetical protein